MIPGGGATAFFDGSMNSRNHATPIEEELLDMKRSLLISVAVLVLVGLAMVESAWALEYTFPGYAPEASAWHGNYYHTAWGMPVALLVPPTAKTQIGWGWGVGNTRHWWIHSQFHRNWPGPGSYDPRTFRPTPRWPSDTDQFGVYYVRGPW